MHGVRVFAGRRLDPFFIDLVAEQATHKLERLAFLCRPRRGGAVRCGPGHAGLRSGRRSSRRSGVLRRGAVLRRTAAERWPDFTTLGALAVLEAERGGTAGAAQ